MPPRHPVGTAGAIRYYRPKDGRGWRARTTYRDHDGVTREVQRHGKTKAAAGRALAVALRDRVYVGAGGDLSPDSQVSELLERWFADLTAEGRAPRTLERYAHEMARLVIPAVGSLRIRELTVAATDRFIRAVQEKHGAATAKLCRSILGGACGWAARRDLLASNPTRDVGRLPTRPRKAVTALTVAQAIDLRMWLRYDDVALRRDVVELIDFLLATGVRIGEACAVHWCDLDLEEGTVEVSGNIVRLKGVGLVRQEVESSKLVFRTLGLPVWAVKVLRARRDRRGGAPDDPTFPAPLGGWRDPSNSQADLRDAFDWCGYPGVTSHVVGRKTTLTTLDEAGVSATLAADQAGHRDPSMTSDRYYGRRRKTEVVTRALEALGGDL